MDEDWELVNSEEAHYRHPHKAPMLQFSFNLTIGSNMPNQEESNRSHQSQSHPRNMATVKEYDTAFNDQLASPFFRLPLELRLRIYEDVLWVEETVSLKSSHQTYPQEPPSTILSLLGTCRRVSDEAAGIFYSVNELEITGRDVISFVHKLSSQRLEAIKQLTVIVGSGANLFHTAESLKKLPNLRGLLIKRSRSIHSTYVPEWAIMKKQIKTELQLLPQLQKLEIYTPGLAGPKPENIERAARMEEIDNYLKEGLQPIRI